jgi:hypothetical protein
MAKIYLKASLLVIWLGSGISEDMEHYQAASRISDEIIRYKKLFGDEEGDLRRLGTGSTMCHLKQQIALPPQVLSSRCCSTHTLRAPGLDENIFWELLGGES